METNSSRSWWRTKPAKHTRKRATRSGGYIECLNASTSRETRLDIVLASTHGQSHRICNLTFRRGANISRVGSKTQQGRTGGLGCHAGSKGFCDEQSTDRRRCEAEEAGQAEEGKGERAREGNRKLHIVLVCDNAYAVCLALVYPIKLKPPILNPYIILVPQSPQPCLFRS